MRHRLTTREGLALLGLQGQVQQEREGLTEERREGMTGRRAHARELELVQEQGLQGHQQERQEQQRLYH